MKTETINKLSSNEKALDKLEAEFIKELKKINIELPKEVSARIDGYCLYLYMDENRFTTITLYPNRSNYGTARKNEINFGTSGSFDPGDKDPYWRTITAASILKNWDKVCVLVNKYCSEWDNLRTLKSNPKVSKETKAKAKKAVKAVKKETPLRDYFAALK